MKGIFGVGAGLTYSMVTGSYLNVADALSVGVDFAREPFDKFNIIDDSYIKKRKIGLAEKGEGEHVDLLAGIIYAEAALQNSPTRMCVGKVVLNRVEDFRYPESIEDVVVSSGQFDGAKSTRNWKQARGEVVMNNYEKKVYGSCLEDAKSVLTGRGIVLPNYNIIAFHDKSVSYEGLCERDVYWKSLKKSFDSDGLVFYEHRV